MGYKLYASMGTGDFYTEHGVEVSFSNTITLSNIVIFSCVCFCHSMNVLG